jgi:hypothetical protein
MTKKEAALSQINGAIKHFEDKEYACAITLAAAAEGQLTPEEGSKHLLAELRVRVPPEFKNDKEWVDWLNAAVHWLKHPTEQHGDEWEIDKASAAIMIMRAITKFEWTYKQGTKRMRQFLGHWKSDPFEPRTQH